jgi:hypothetical protein
MVDNTTTQFIYVTSALGYRMPCSAGLKAADAEKNTAEWLADSD